MLKNVVTPKKVVLLPLEECDLEFEYRLFIESLASWKEHANAIPLGIIEHFYEEIDYDMCPYCHDVKGCCDCEEILADQHEDYGDEFDENWTIWDEIDISSSDWYLGNF